MPATTQRDYYGILGVAPDADADTIRRAFWRLAKLWHPDRYRTAPDQLREQAERRMRLLTEAHAVLGDPARRAEYDHTYEGGIAGMRARDGVEYGAQPFPMSPTFSIPGYTPTVSAGPATSDPHGLTIFILITASIICFAFVGIAASSGNWGNRIVAGGIALVVAVLAVVLLVRDGPVDEIVQADRAAEARTPTPRQTTITLSDFEELVQTALDDLPPEFAAELKNVTIFVEEEPSMEVLRRVGVKPGWTLFGLYEGVPITKQSVFHAGPPESITLFQAPIERHCLFVPERIAYQVRATLLHEVAHHFGLDHDEMPIWVKA
jgi:predicted Zn-dependent protease with MMP-like domain